MIQPRKFDISPPDEWVQRPQQVHAWSQQVYDILQTLALRVRIMAIQQIAYVWWHDDADDDSVTQVIQQLASAGLVEHFVINAHPLLEVEKPVCRWIPGQPVPDCQQVSERVRSRWNRDSVSMDVVVATKKTANLFGGGAYGIPPIEHRDHDLLLSDAYLAFRRYRPRIAQQWIGEDFLPKAGFMLKDPDAFLIDPTGQPIGVVESAGKYQPNQILSFHEHCASLALPYELW